MPHKGNEKEQSKWIGSTALKCRCSMYKRKVRMKPWKICVARVYAASTATALLERPGLVVVVVVAAPTAGLFPDRDLDALVGELLG